MASSLTILFWNVQGKDLSVNIARLMKRHGVDLVVLAEIPDVDVRLQLANHTSAPVFYINNTGVLAGKTHLYSVHPSAFTVHRGSNPLGRLNVFEVDIPLFPRLVLGTVHLASKVNAREEDQSEEAQVVVGELREQRRLLGIEPLLVCGDFNLSPFERGMRGPRYFHAVMDRRLARLATRTTFGRQYPVLYNPMWSLMGDRSAGPPGTYFHGSSTHDNVYWHTLDQFLLSPELLQMVDVAEVAILGEDGAVAFISPSGRIKRNVYSDHLPILLRLTEKT